MPTVACPGCHKQYKLAESAIGQVASCKCGKKFRVGGKATPAATTAAKPTSAPAASAARDAFWDDALRESPSVTSSAAPSTGSPARAATSSVATPSKTRVDAKGRPITEKPEPEKKKPKKKRVVWGFQWGKVGAGFVVFAVAGGICALAVIEGGVLPVKIAVIAGVGLFTMLSGLMGEEGIW
jgi:hypothetical protein